VFKLYVGGVKEILKEISERMEDCGEDELMTIDVTIVTEPHRPERTKRELRYVLSKA
jgi:hypothetical protein